MKAATVNPTPELYGQLLHIYDHFNQELFGGELSTCMITVQREKNTTGFFIPERWSNVKGKRYHEIALHPGHFVNRKLIELFQTMVHEQCHLWQREFGSPSRPGYHNQEWAAKMDSIGLIPSSTGRPKGKRTGQRMMDYPAKNGPFTASSLKLVSEGFQLNWVDRRPTSNRQEEESGKECRAGTPEERLYLDVVQTISGFVYLRPPKNAKQKVKVTYHCSMCEARVWGKPDLSLRCEECNNPLTVVTAN